MIHGIGIDIVTVERISKKVANSKFAQKIFTASETAYCNNAEKFAGSYVAKEAFFKSLETGIINEFDLLQVGSINNVNGKLLANVTGATLEKISSVEINNIHVSISHEKQYNTSIIILET